MINFQNLYENFTTQISCIFTFILIIIIFRKCNSCGQYSCVGCKESYFLSSFVHLVSAGRSLTFFEFYKKWKEYLFFLVLFIAFILFFLMFFKLIQNSRDFQIFLIRILFKKKWTFLNFMPINQLTGKSFPINFQHLQHLILIFSFFSICKKKN